MANKIIIGSTPRTRKSTLSKLLFDKYPLNTLSTDFPR